jgi:hypothetical protein
MNDVKFDDDKVVPAAADAAQVKKTLSIIMKVVTGITKVTKTELDDNVVAFLAPIVESDEFAEVLASLMDQFKAEGRKPTFARVKSAMLAKLK